MPDELRVPIAKEQDIVTARMRGRDLAKEFGFSKIDGTLIATAISEIARNIIVHAGKGEIIISHTCETDRCGITIVAQDFGPGISDVERVVQQGQGSSGLAGLGLPGARRLMDEFDITSELGKGTTVVLKKWRIQNHLGRVKRSKSG